MATGTTALSLAAALSTVTITLGMSTLTLARASAVTYELFRLSKLRLTSKDYLHIVRTYSPSWDYQANIKRTLPVSSESEGRKRKRQKMKRSNIGIKDIATFENAEDAYRKARKCKRYREEVLRFTDNLEEELYDLVADMEAGTDRQGEARRFVVYEPKKRDIYALPFRDRVAQHMINNKIEPIVERRFYYHSYACRTDKGMHKAADYAQECIRNLSFEGKQVYILKADIHKYFNSVDHEVLKQILSGIFKDKDLLNLLYYIIDSYGEDGRGLPVGNLLSQLFANLVLNELDNFVKHELKEDKYTRYMDDFAIVSNSWEHLVEVLQR